MSPKNSLSSVFETVFGPFPINSSSSSASISIDGLGGPAATLFISRDAYSDSIAELVGASFLGYRTIIARYVGRAPLQKCVGDFLLYKFGRILPGIFLEDFSGHFSPEEKKSGGKIREKIRRPKNKNPRKIRSAKNRR